MKSLLFIITLLLSSIAISQTISPVIENFNSISQPGDAWRLISGQPNAGAHSGDLCYNITGNYLDNEYYSFESITYDFSLWAEVSVEISIQSNIRNGDMFAFYYYDNATASWAGFDISNLTGIYTVTVPVTTTMFSFDLNTNSNGNINGKYAHADYIIISDPSVPLPIELLYFEGEKQDNTNVLNWATASEANTDYFDIEWSRDAYTWDVVGTLAAAGNSNMNLYYSFIEPCPLPIINYYRLVQYDWDGHFEIIDPIVIDNRQQEKRIVKYVSMSGQEIDPTSTTGLVLGILEDGTTIKVYL